MVAVEKKVLGFGVSPAKLRAAAPFPLFFLVLLFFSGFVFAEPSYYNMSDVYQNFSFIGNNLMFQVRTGSDPGFPGVSFVGPDNTSNTWFWENQTTNNLYGLLNTGRYFQYNAFLYRNDSIGQTWSPNLYNVTVSFINSTETDVPSIASPVYPFTTLNCTTIGYSPLNSTVAITFSWYINGVFNSSSTSVFNVNTVASATVSPPASGFTAGDVWNCSVNASDGSTSSPALSTNVSITAYAANTYALISSVYTDFSWYGGNTWTQVRSCWQPDCSDGVFFGPDNSSNSWFDSSPANLSLTNITQTRYFQYREFLYCNYTLNQTWSPNLYNATVNAENASAINVSLNAPANASWSASRNVNFTFTPTDLVSFVNCSLSLYYANGTSFATVLNVSNIANGSVNGINYTFASDATFLWNAACADSVQSNSSASNRTVFVDATPPVVSSNSPVDYLNSSNQTIVFNGTGSDNRQLANVSLYANFTGVWGANATNSTPTNNSPVTFSRSLGNGQFVWSFQACDAASNCVFSGNRSLVVDAVAPSAIAYISPTPANGSWRNYNYSFVNVTFTETNPDSCLLNYIYPNSSNVNLTMTRSGTNCWFNVSSQPDGQANFTVYVNDSAGNAGSNTSYYRFFVDMITPSMNITSPLNASSHYANATMTINVTVNDAGLLDKAITNSTFWTGIFSNSSATAFNLTNTTTLAASALHCVNVIINDSAGNLNSSFVCFELIGILVSPTPPPPGGGFVPGGHFPTPTPSPSPSVSPSPSAVASVEPVISPSPAPITGLLNALASSFTDASAFIAAAASLWYVFYRKKRENA